MSSVHRLEHHVLGGLVTRIKRPEHVSERVSERANLVYVHGLGESSLSLERVMRDPRLSDATHFAPDLVGYGRTPWAQSALSLDEHASRLAHWLQDVELDCVVLIGHSMGGVIGQKLAAFLEGSGNGALEALINVEGNISRDDCTASITASNYELEDFLEHGFTTLLEQLYESGHDDPSFRGYYASARFCDPRAFHLNSRELVELSLGETLAAHMGELETRSVYLYGHPGGAGKHTRDLLERAGVEARGFSPAGHWPFLDQHDDFVVEVRALLDSWL